MHTYVLIYKLLFATSEWFRCACLRGITAEKINQRKRAYFSGQSFASIVIR